MKFKLHPIAFLFAVAATSTQAGAQERSRGIILGAGAGVFVYTGDLTPTDIGSYRTLKPAINLFAGKILSPSFALRANVALGGLKGDETEYDDPEYRRERAFKFRTPVTEVSGIAEWNFLRRNESTKRFSPYLMAGIAAGFYTIRRDWSELNADYFPPDSRTLTGLLEDEKQTPPKTLLVFPVGLGARYFISDKIGISIETLYRITDSDYLDGFSQAVNPDKKDAYYSHTIGIVYRIGKRNTLDCPTVPY